MRQGIWIGEFSEKHGSKADILFRFRLSTNSERDIISEGGRRDR